MGVVGVLLLLLDRALGGTTAERFGALDHLALWGWHAVTAAALGLLGALWMALHRVAGGRAWVAGILLALAGAVPLRLVAAALVSGDWISRQRLAPALEIAAFLVPALGLLALGWLHARAPGPGPRRLLLPVAQLAFALAASVADARVLPGLYPTVHLALYGASALLLALAAARLSDLLLAEPRPRIALALAALAPAGLIAAAALVPGRTGALVSGSRSAALVLPYLAGPTRVIAEELVSVDGRAEAEPEPLDARAAVDRLLGGRRDLNVLLIVVDTLRADTLPPWRGAGRRFATEGDTPFLDAWLGQAFRFRRAYTQASRTRRSLPPTFRSLEANEDAERVGIPLGAQATELGLLPVAVVPQYFLLPESEQAQHLLLGFDRVTFYEKNRQELVVERAREAFEGLKGRRFFAWLHFYNMHDPYFAGRPLGAADGPASARYQKALGWLDARMKQVWSDLEAAGLAESTVVIFTADHGELLGEGGGNGHGAGVREAEVRAPLAVRIPGQPGRELDVPAGNVDLVPTLLDLAGARPLGRHRGRSLLPVIAGADRRTLPYYFENASGSVQGVAVGPQKLVHRGPGGLFHRFDTARDPREKRDLYEPQGRVDRSLRRALLRKNPSLFADELRDPEVRRLLGERLGEIGKDARPTSDLTLLLQLAALSREPRALREAERIFQEARDPGAASLVASHLSAADPARWRALVSRRLHELAGQPEERVLVEALARQGQPELDLPPIARRLADLARATPEQAAPWLSLIRPWKKPAASFAEPLAALLAAFPTGARSAERTLTLVLLLECAGSLEHDAGAAPPSALTKLVRAALDDADPRVAVAAARTLGHLSEPSAAPVLRERLADGRVDVRIRQALMLALADLEGEAAAAAVIRAGEDPLLTVDAIQILGRLGAAEALPFLRGVVESHYNRYTREEARKAMAAIKREAR